MAKKALSRPAGVFAARGGPLGSNAAFEERQGPTGDLRKGAGTSLQGLAAQEPDDRGGLAQQDQR